MPHCDRGLVHPFVVLVTPYILPVCSAAEELRLNGGVHVVS